MKNYKMFVIAFLLGIAIFTSFKYFILLKEKHALLNTINEIKEQLQALENEKQNLLQTIEKEKALQQKLTQENLGLKGSLKASEEKTVQLNSDLSKNLKDIEQLNAQLVLLKADLASLKQERDKLNLELTQAAQENENLKLQLRSIAEQKKATQGAKEQIRKVGKEIKKQVDTEKPATEEKQEGNRGFLLKEGSSINPAKVKIEVVPAPEGQ